MEGIEHASEELIGIVEATSAPRCEEQENCRADFFLHAAEAGSQKQRYSDWKGAPCRLQCLLPWREFSSLAGQTSLTRASLPCRFNLG